MEVSIIIVNFNTPNLIEDCVKSIKNSRIKVSYEVIVVDNGSKKESVKKIKDLKKYALIHRSIFNKANLGFSKANNIGIKDSKGKYKLLLNSDTIVKKGSVDELIKFAKKTKNVGVVGSRLLNKDGSIQKSCFNFPTLRRAINQYWLKKGVELNKFAPDTKKPVEVDSVVGASFLISPIALKKVGLLDERYFMFFEDIDYCRRVWRSGLKVFYLPQSEVYHLHGQSGKKILKQADQWKRLIPSSKIYHGSIKHYLFNFILWSGQKAERLKGKHG